ncbi:MAG: hypothetical protein CEO22_143 [Candidatus Berkelbacteria bacterium Gr01-1014_85]|uniref:Uncharacterized protein n=1 Tax=Candidatus Berkelbacteria bacterium Gr01-1014_85 TaxID=2017150 RepID=A0A554JD67_9BACT|nr:MAG: hypothetical protein CEO22_143 [Candidatus Berkelbacteria bacterium Gr01-1014_85]
MLSRTRGKYIRKESYTPAVTSLVRRVLRIEY